MPDSPTARIIFLVLISTVPVHSPSYFQILSILCNSVLADIISRVGQRNKTAYHVRRHNRLMQITLLSTRGTQIGSKICEIVYSNSKSEVFSISYIFTPQLSPRSTYGLGVVLGRLKIEDYFIISSEKLKRG